MKRPLVPLAIFLFLVALMIVGLKHAPEKELVASPLIGKPVPAFKAPVLTDAARQATHETLAGQWRLINVWGTWCVGCRQEHPALLAIQKEGKVPIIGLDWKDNDADAIAWLSQLGNPYQEVGADRDGRIAIDFGVYGAPESFLVNPQGVIVKKQIGIMTLDAWQRDFLPCVEGSPACKS